MKKILLFVFLSSFLFSYYLVVSTQNDADKLKNIGIGCKYSKSQQYYVCAQSDDLDQLKRVKQYISLNYSVSTYIVQSNGLNSVSSQYTRKAVKKTYVQNAVKTQPENKTVYKTSDEDIPKTGYCVQVAAGKSEKAMLKIFNKYSSYPVSRVEKIGSYYVLRIGESKNYESVKKLQKRLGRGFVRKCDYKPERIIKSKKKIAEFSKRRVYGLSPVEKMYTYLNAGEFVKAEKLAEVLKNTKNKKDAYNVLGIIAMKKSDFKRSCRYLKMSDDFSLMKTACYLYNLKRGYSQLNLNPSKALLYFKKAGKYKNGDNLKAAEGYAYLNMKKYRLSKKIFAALYKKKPHDLNVLKGYVISLYNLKDYSKLKQLKNKLNKKELKSVENYYFYISLHDAQQLTELKKYKKAEKILTRLYKKRPENINVMLALANVYMKENRLQDAEKYYKNVLLLSSNDIYALEGLRAIALKRGEYRKALEYSKKLSLLGIKTDDGKIADILKMRRLREYIKDRDCKQALNTINTLNNYTSADKYMLVGDFYSECEYDKNKSFYNYEKGYSLDKNNFDVKLKFLYVLLNRKMFPQIKEILKTVNKKKLNELEKIRLKQFYVNYYSALASEEYKKNRYKYALDLCKEAEKYGKAPACYEISGWSCFRLKKYECSEKNFKNALKYHDNDDNRYALVLSLIKLGKYTEADKILKKLTVSDNPEMKVKAAKAYLMMREYGKSEKILNNIHNSDLKKEIKPVYAAINREKSNYLNYLEAGVDFRYKSGTQGLDKLNDSVNYIKGVYYLDSKESLFLKIGSVDLFSGSGVDYTSVGSTGVLKQKNYFTDYQGTAFKAGYSYKSDKIFEFYLGITPLSGDSNVKSSVTGMVKAGIKKGRKKYFLSLTRESVKDSILSYVGNNDPYSENSYGRVLSNELRIEYENLYDINDSLLYLSAAVSNLNGQNVKNNRKYELDALCLQFFGHKILDYDYAGVYAMYQKYRYNENSFYYGNGGYFSPQYFILLALRYEGYKFYNSGKFGIKTYISAGPMKFKDSSETTSLGFETGAYAKYLLNGSFALKGGFAFRKSTDYSDFFINFALQYYFGRKSKITKTELNEGLKEMLKTW